MPIYEFYCHKCNTVYNFFSRSVNTEKIPFCPNCKTVRLKRQLSLFAAIKGKKEGVDMADGDIPQLDEGKMEKAMSLLSQESEKINEDDPRQAAMLMRKVADIAGINMGKGVEEALNRMERGDDPDMIEQEMEHILADEDPFTLEGKPGKRSLQVASKPLVDDTIYDL